MTAPNIAESDPLEELLALKRAGSEASDPLDDLMSTKAGQPSPYQQRIRKEQAAGILDDRIRRENLNEQEMVEATTPSYAAQAFGGVASLIRDIPGAEAAQAGVRAALRGQSYDEAYQDIRGAEEDAPKWVRRYNRVAGSLPAVLALPGSAVRQGATYGALSGLTQADPDAGIGERAKDAAVGGTVGAAAGKAGELLGTGARAVVSRLRRGSPADIAIAREASTDAATRTNYGKVAEEAAATGGTSPAVQNALAAPDIAPIVAMFKQSRQHAGASDAELLRRAYAHLSSLQRRGDRITAAADDYRSGTEFEKGEIAAAKKELLNAAETATPATTAQIPAGTGTMSVTTRAAAPASMPSLRHAITEKARAESEREAFERAVDATRRITGKKSTPAKKLTKKSPEAFRASVKGMKPNEASAAREGVLAEYGDDLGFSLNPFKGFGIANATGRANRVGPVVKELDAASLDNETIRMLRAAGLNVSPANVRAGGLPAALRAAGLSVATP